MTDNQTRPFRLMLEDAENCMHYYASYSTSKAAQKRGLRADGDFLVTDSRTGKRVIFYD